MVGQEVVNEFCEKSLSSNCSKRESIATKQEIQVTNKFALSSELSTEL